jgi:hypothetical protein
MNQNANPINQRRTYVPGDRWCLVFSLDYTYHLARKACVSNVLLLNHVILLSSGVARTATLSDKNLNWVHDNKFAIWVDRPIVFFLIEWNGPIFLFELAGQLYLLTRPNKIDVEAYKLPMPPVSIRVICPQRSYHSIFPLSSFPSSMVL